MEKNGIKFDITGKTVIVRGYPELEGKEGSMAGNGMANRENPQTIHIRGNPFGR